MQRCRSYRKLGAVRVSLTAGVLASLVVGCGQAGLEGAGHEGVDTLESGLERVVAAPDVKLTAHIREFSTDAYMAEIDAHPELSPGMFKRLAMVAALKVIRSSANEEPPEFFDSPQTGHHMTWYDFQDTKEHRGVVHLRGASIHCLDGTIQSVTAPEVDEHPGWTKEPFGRFTEGERLVFATGFRPGLTVEQTKGGSCLQVTNRQGSRMNEGARKQQALVFGYDAAFIWTKINQELCCDGTSTLNVEHSAFPTHRVYVNDELVRESEQRGFAEFLVAGGKDASEPGYGRLAPAAVEHDQI